MLSYESQSHNTNNKLMVSAQKTITIAIAEIKAFKSMGSISCSFIKSSTAKNSPFFIICDLGSGAGRDVCFLAEELNFFLYQLLQLELDAENNNQIADLTVSSQLSRIKLSTVGIDNHKGNEKKMYHFRKIVAPAFTSKLNISGLRQIKYQGR